MHSIRDAVVLWLVVCGKSNKASCTISSCVAANINMHSSLPGMMRNRGWMDGWISLPSSHLSSGAAQSVTLPSTELMKEGANDCSRHCGPTGGRAGNGSGDRLNASGRRRRTRFESNADSEFIRGSTCASVRAGAGGRTNVFFNCVTRDFMSCSQCSLSPHVYPCASSLARPLVCNQDDLFGRSVLS